MAESVTAKSPASPLHALRRNPAGICCAGRSSTRAKGFCSSRIPAVALKESNMPRSAAAKGLANKITSAARPSELRESGSRRKRKPPRYKSIMIPARVTDGEKPASPMKNRTNPIEQAADTRRLHFSFCSMRKRNIAHNDVCRPDTASRCETPQIRKFRMAVSETGAVSPSSIPPRSFPSSPGKYRLRAASIPLRISSRRQARETFSRGVTVMGS